MMSCAMGLYTLLQDHQAIEKLAWLVGPSLSITL